MGRRGDGLMASNAASITRTKRRKPMPPGVKRYLAWVLVDVLFVMWAGYDWSGGDTDAWSTIGLVGWSFCLAMDWPRFWREWEAWRRGA